MLEFCLSIRRMFSRSSSTSARRAPIQDTNPMDIPLYPAADLKKISPETLKSLNVEQLLAFTPNQIGSMPKQTRERFKDFLEIAQANARADQERKEKEQERARADQETVRAEQEKARAEQEKARADQQTAIAGQERARADQEKARADRLQLMLDNEIKNLRGNLRSFIDKRNSNFLGEEEKEALTIALEHLVNIEQAQLNSLKSNSPSEETVKALISGRPILPAPVTPRWGEGVDAKTPTRSTTTSPIWLQFLENDVADWSEVEFVMYLEKAPAALLEKLLNAKVNGSLASRFSGSYLKDLVKESNGKEAVIEYLLQRGVWQALQDLCDTDEIKEELTCGIRSGEASHTISIPPQFKGLLKPDRIIEVRDKRKPSVGVFKNEWENSTGIDIDKWGEQAKIPVEYMQGGFGATAMEIKPPHLNPVFFTKIPSEFTDSASRGGPSFVSVLQSHGKSSTSADEKANIEKFNPVSQVGTYAAAYRLSKVAICDLNTIAYGRLVTAPLISTIQPGIESGLASGAEVSVESGVQVGVRTRHFMYISKRFDWTSSDPPLASRTWSHWEILLRWVLASLGNSMLEKMPDTLKEVAKVALFRKKRNSNDGNTGAASGSASGSGQDAEEEGSKRTRSSKKSGRHEEQESEYGPIYWEELWDPIRFAIPATHSVDVETTQDRLPGDALLLAHQRTGPIYRKTIRNVDAVVKVALRYDPDREDDTAYSNLVIELGQEAVAYGRLKGLQGRYIPKFLWHGEIMPNAAFALATEYAGRPLHSQQNLSAIMARSALKALDAIHSAGVAHGDIRLANLLVKELSQQVCIIDFGQSRFQEDLPAAEWDRIIAEERTAMESLVGLRETQKSSLGGGSSRKRRMSSELGT